MRFRFLAIICLAAMTLQVSAEKRLHFDLDYHFNLGLSQRIMGISMSPKDVDYMEGHSLHFAMRYDITKRLSAGAGIGIDAYLSGAGNYGKTPLYATCRYKIITDKSFFKGLYGFTNVGYSISGRPMYRGAMFDLGVGWPIMLTKNFGINLQYRIYFTRWPNSCREDKERHDKTFVVVRRRNNVLKGMRLPVKS